MCMDMLRDNTLYKIRYFATDANKLTRKENRSTRLNWIYVFLWYVKERIWRKFDYIDYIDYIMRKNNLK